MSSQCTCCGSFLHESLVLLPCLLYGSQFIRWSFIFFSYPLSHSYLIIFLLNNNFMLFLLISGLYTFNPRNIRLEIRTFSAVLYHEVILELFPFSFFKRCNDKIVAIYYHFCVTLRGILYIAGSLYRRCCNGLGDLVKYLKK